MCGLCGIVHHTPDRLADKNLLQAMARTIAHRGPAANDFYLRQGVGLAICALAGAGRQLFFSNEDGSIWAMADGEIYNHQDLRNYLRAKGHTLCAGSDKEILPHLYEEVAENLPQQLNGVFALAVWDRRNRRLLLARDRLGVKPLYFAEFNGGVAFASELRAVMQHPEVNREIDLMAFSEYLTLQHSMPPRTILAGVQKLAPGHVIIYQEGHPVIRPYWNLHFPPEADKEFNESQHVERFRQAFATAVKRPLKAGRPVGAFLSGGMDSSSIVAMLWQLGLPEIYTYSGGHSGSGQHSELSRACIVAGAFNTRHSELAFTAQDYLNALPRFIRYMDDPVADEASLIRMLLAGRARKDVALLLGGEAADDVMGGYGFGDLQKRFDRLRRFQRLPPLLRETLPALLSPFLPHRLQAWLARGNRDMATINAAEHYAMVWAFEAEEKRRYCPPLRDVDDHCYNLARDIYARSGAADPLSQVLYFFTKTWVAESLLMSADKMAMSYGLDFRPVFLDQDLVELSAQIPSCYKIRREPNGSYTTKNILRRAMRDILPDSIMNLPKLPFTVPTEQWFQGAMAGYCRQILLSAKARACGLYDARQVEALLERHCHTPGAQSMLQIRNLLFFELWRQTVLEQSQPFTGKALTAAPSVQVAQPASIAGSRVNTEEFHNELA